jgi:hypothetical protein
MLALSDCVEKYKFSDELLTSFWWFYPPPIDAEDNRWEVIQIAIYVSHKKSLIEPRMLSALLPWP